MGKSFTRKFEDTADTSVILFHSTIYISVKSLQLTVSISITITTVPTKTSLLDLSHLMAQPDVVKYYILSSQISEGKHIS